MSQLRGLHREFIEQSQRPMDLGRLPVAPRPAEVPILPMERWTITGGMLTKRYEFRTPDLRLNFITALLQYERETHHNAVLIIDEGAVIVKLVTKNIDQVTELDKEYARFADVVFRDLVYNPPNVQG